MEDDINHRLVLDNVANTISQVNSNGEGYSKTIKLPSDIGYYKITVGNKKLVIEYDGKKGETLLPLLKIDSNYEMQSGKSYTVSKEKEGKIVIS